MYQSMSIIGNVSQEVEMRYTPGGVPVSSFSVAVNKRWRAENGEEKEKVTYFRVTAWRKLGELVNQYLSKGRQVHVVGELDVSAYIARDGDPKASLELTAKTVNFLGNRSDFDGKPTNNFAAEDRAQERSNSEDIPF